MTFKNFIAGSFILLNTFSCIQDEALNVEAAIDACNGKNIQLSTIDHTNKEIEVYVLADTDVSAQELHFTLADGATIKADDSESNDNPPLFDFSNSPKRRFTVTSEDGHVKTTYTVRINKLDLPTSFSFENLKPNENYNILYVSDEQGILEWASGNPGFQLCGMALSAQDYPTVMIESGGISGNYVKLTTRSTGNFGSAIGMPIAAGNLFIGSFDLPNAVLHPLTATRFGYPFTRIPKIFRGWFKYKKGSSYTDAQNHVVTDKEDRGDIYAVLYEAPTSDYTLDGSLFPQDGPINPSIVLMARIAEEDMIETDRWTRFSMNFLPQNGKTVNFEDLKNGKYKLAIVFSSSIEGAYFNGAVGSELCIDEVEIICE